MLRGSSDLNRKVQRDEKPWGRNAQKRGGSFRLTIKFIRKIIKKENKNPKFERKTARNKQTFRRFQRGTWSRELKNGRNIIRFRIKKPRTRD